MWLLRSSKDELYYLLVEKYHVVGRKDGDLILSDDQSISRRHAVIHVEHVDLGNPSKLPVVSLSDTGSKYGTYINDGMKVSARVTRDSTVVLKDGDHIRFGLQWNNWRLEYTPLVVTTSTLTPDGNKDLSKQLRILGGHVVDSWQNTVTHVTMCSLTLTVKAVLALANGKPIVTPQYWHDYIAALSNKQPLPDYKDYIPLMAETTLNANEVSLDVNENRKKLFVGKHFMFSSSDQYHLLSCMVAAAGGKASILEEDGIDHEYLVKPNVIVMRYLFGPSQGSTGPSWFKEVKRYLKSRGKRVIPESDIGLAILYCSVDRHCNPDYKVTSVLSSRVTREVNSHTEHVLALDTQESKLEDVKKIKDAARDIVIPESGTVQKHVCSGVAGASATKDTLNWESMDAENEVFIMSARGVEKESLTVREESDGSRRANKRFRSLEGTGVLITRAAAPECSQTSVILGRDVKRDSDDENWFEFPSDKKLRPAPHMPEDEEDEDMFAFVDDVKRRSHQEHSKKDKSAELSVLPRKRKLQSSENVSEPSSFTKRRASEKDVLQRRDTDSHNNAAAEHSVATLEGFLSVVDDSKENAALDRSMMDLADDLKNVTVVQVKALVSRTAVHPRACATTSGHVGANFKKFRKVQATDHSSLIRSQDLVPYNIDTKGPSEWGKSHSRDAVENDGDWAFIEPAQTNKKKTEAKHS